jgi:hypothetical protein
VRDESRKNADTNHTSCTVRQRLSRFYSRRGGPKTGFDLASKTLRTDNGVR